MKRAAHHRSRGTAGLYPNESGFSRVLADVETITALMVVAGEEDPRGRLERLFECHHLRLYRFALRMTRGDDEALDLVQEAFVRAAREQHRLPADDGRAGAWLVRVVVNLLHDRYRRRQVRQAFRIGWVAPPERDFTEAIDTRDAVRTAIAQLPPRQRAIIIMFELEERSISEIATELGLAAVTVRWHLSTARKRLAQLLQGTTK
jgi:RNA polymerase sigma factor (sigma-70 family)